MVITSGDIKKEIRKIYHNLSWMIFTDKKYVCPSHEELDSFLKQNINDTLPYVKGIYECEEFAFGFMVDARRARAKNAIDVHETYYNWPIGVILVKFVSTQVHWANVALTSDSGIFYIDAEKKKLQTLDELKGKVHYLIM